jgi:GNAT superfamily N-acetyltransferase
MMAATMPEARSGEVGWPGAPRSGAALAFRWAKAYHIGEALLGAWSEEDGMKLHLMLELDDASGEDDGEVLPLTAVDTKAMGAAFLDAYLDTIDYEGEGIEDAIAEVRDLFAGAYGRLHPEVSGCILKNGSVASALIAAESGDGIFIPYVITTKGNSGRGFATRLIKRAILQAKHGGYRFIDLYVTRGNDRAEGLYRRLGFRDVPLNRPEQPPTTDKKP